MYAHRGWVDKGSEVQALRPLTPLVMMALEQDQLCDAATELFTDILNHFPAFLTVDDFRRLSSFLSTDDACKKISRLKGGEIDEDTMPLAKLLLGYGDAAVQDLARKPDDPKLTQIMYQLLELLSCNGYGGLEDEVCSQALEFWTTYTEFVVDSLFDNEEEEKPAWMGVAKQRLEAVIEACWLKIRMPQHEVAATWDSDARSSFKNFRKDVHDLLLSSYRLLGVDIFRKLAHLALQSVDNHAWLPLEATLFCLNALADSVVDDEAVDDILSEILGSQIFIIMTNTEEKIPAKTRQTAVSMISSYTAFFERRTEHLLGMLNFLFESLRSPALAHVVAKALFSICSSCRKTLASEVNTFLQQYEQILEWDCIDLSVKEKLIGAISAIIEAMPKDEAKILPLGRLIGTIEKDVESCFEAISTSNTTESYSIGIGALKSLGSMGKALQAPDVAVIDLDTDVSQSTFWTDGPGTPLQSRILQIIDVLMPKMSQNCEAVEAACQIFRAGYKERTPGLFVFPLKVSVDFVLSSTLNTARLDYVLDTAGICLLSRASDAEHSVIDAASSFLNYLLALVDWIACKFNHRFLLQRMPLLRRKRRPFS